jgi:DNA topoisomerase-1
MEEPLLKKLETHHIYTAADLARSLPEWLATALDIPMPRAQQLIQDAMMEMEILRRRSECRKFVRDNLAPKKGRSYAAIMKVLKNAGIHDIAALARADAAVFKSAGVGEKEAKQVIAGAQALSTSQTFKEIGIPVPSIKKYRAAGITTAEEFCALHPVMLSERAGISLDTVYRHAGLVCRHINRPVPGKVTKLQLEKGRKELLTIHGMTELITGQLLLAGIVDGTGLLSADPECIAARTGIPAETIRNFQELIKKKADSAVIRI